MPGFELPPVCSAPDMAEFLRQAAEALDGAQRFGPAMITGGPLPEGAVHVRMSDEVARLWAAQFRAVATAMETEPETAPEQAP